MLKWTSQAQVVSAKGGHVRQGRISLGLTVVYFAQVVQW